VAGRCWNRNSWPLLLHWLGTSAAHRISNNFSLINSSSGIGFGVAIAKTPRPQAPQPSSWVSVRASRDASRLLRVHLPPPWRGTAASSGSRAASRAGASVWGFAAANRQAAAASKTARAAAEERVGWPLLLRCRCRQLEIQTVPPFTDTSICDPSIDLPSGPALDLHRTRRGHHFLSSHGNPEDLASPRSLCWDHVRRHECALVPAQVISSDGKQHLDDLQLIHWLATSSTTQPPFGRKDCVKSSVLHAKLW
jgi:hypothetical protein